MKKSGIVKIERESMKRDMTRRRGQLKNLSVKFDYNYFNCGYAAVATFSETFEEYLELTAKLPIENELHSYELHFHKQKDDSLRIVHKVNYPDNIVIYYTFLVGEVERTLDKLTEGKCKIVEKVTTERQYNYTSLSCNI